MLTTIPFAVLGAFWTLFVSGTPMDSIGWIGIIILVGVVVNNGIVLIDKIHRLRIDERYSRQDAVIEGAGARVRPIVMTALTTVVGLMPMALGEAPPRASTTGPWPPAWPAASRSAPSSPSGSSPSPTP